MSADRHAAVTEVHLDAITSPDPDLYLARADMTAWLEAHPCSCEALCVCDMEELPEEDKQILRDHYTPPPHPLSGATCHVCGANATWYMIDYSGPTIYGCEEHR